MTISYNWLCEYLPIKVDPEELSQILTSIGLEVESMTPYEEIKGGLMGLVVGEVVSCEKHPDADKLKLTKVDIGKDSLLNIVCGAPNVAKGQKVIVAPVGTTIYPTHGDSITIKKAKIRGAESEGMICADDEIGLGHSHDGIKILPMETVIGTSLNTLYKPHEDVVFEIGLTPNRMDAMSHLGVARDVCAYLSYHQKKTYETKHPFKNVLNHNTNESAVQVNIKNTEACTRYCGILIADVCVQESPAWLKQRLKSIGLNPINNIVDITNYILHETGQPLHAFDADKIKGNKIEVKKLSSNVAFTTLDEKERKISTEDLMICNEAEPMCIAGVYGGLNSGVSFNTTNIFLESACFDQQHIRKTSLRHGLRTDAAIRFEKGIDISNTLQVLHRAAELMVQITGGKLASAYLDKYPNPKNKTTILFSLSYLKKLSGKSYSLNDVKRILLSLGFELDKEIDDSLEILVPYNKPDISIPADIVEEIMRIDGLDNIDIPTSITITPSVQKNSAYFLIKEKLANGFIGMGFHEMFTNSITNSAFYGEAILEESVKMINSLSNELDILRPKMLESGLQVVAHNLNRKNNDLKLFEFGKTYSKKNQSYLETNHLVLFVTGNTEDVHWKNAAQKSDYFYIKGVVESILTLVNANDARFHHTHSTDYSLSSKILIGNTSVGQIGEIASSTLKKFDIKQPVYFADIQIDKLIANQQKPIQYQEIPKFPMVNRDLALVVDKNVSYSQIEEIALSNKIEQIKKIGLFDVFESDKLGAEKKSMAVSFTFLDSHKTLTDEQIDGYMKKIVSSFEKNLQAEIRK